MKNLFFLFLAISCFASTEQERVRRIQAHLLLDDASSALSEANALVEEFPKSRESRSSLIMALASSGYEGKALEHWHHLSAQYPDLANDRHLLEEMAWGVLKKGLNSTQYGVRLASLIGAFLTNDARALPIFLKMLRDSNAVVRSVAVQMASQYQDAPLKDEIARMLREEKMWMVRLEVIKACGQLRMKETAPLLKTLIQSEKTTYEERVRAIEALCTIYESITENQLLVFSRSDRAGMRHLACNVAAHFEIDGAKEEILRLVHDAHPDVRIAALNAIGTYYRKTLTLEEIEQHLQKAIQDSVPEVAITAAWAASISGLDAESVLQARLKDPLPELRRFTAAAIAASGERGVALASRMVHESEDPYVKANLSIGLLNHRKEVKAASDVLYQFLTKEKRMWMFDARPNPLFQTLAPSQVRHVDHIPNYPEAVDQITRLNLLSFLAVVEDPRALDAVKSFLKKKTWGITGVAAATLLQEGDETALEIVSKLLDDPDFDVRLQACFVMAMFGKDPSSLLFLQEAYPGADHDKKLHILEALGRIGKTESFSFFLSAFNEPFPILRIAAASSLIQSIHR